MRLDECQISKSLIDLLSGEDVGMLKAARPSETLLMCPTQCSVAGTAVFSGSIVRREFRNQA
jgi:hypothetical protein